MVALVVLLFFVVIGLLDSIHFKQANDKTNEVISLLDYWATPIREHQEKSYSAPFSAYLYSKELIRAEDGSQQWSYSRLEYGGRHLQNPNSSVAGFHSF